MKSALAGFALSLLAASAFAGENVIALPNPGFEEKTATWNTANDQGMSVAIPEAAHSGKLGLRVTDESGSLGSSLATRRFPATPGKSYEMRFFARLVKGEGIAVYLRFYNAKGEFLNTPALKNQISAPIRRDATEWKAFAKKGVAPEGAVQVEIWVHSFTDKVVTADFDDFVLFELEG